MFLKFLSTREDSLRMNPYRPIIRNKSTVLCLNCQSKRWVSHDKSELTPDGIRRRIQSGLGENVKLSEDGKELHTKYGSLPTSPIFDPAWVKSHQRERKPAVNKENKLNRFRKKLVNNPYAQALGTPIRECIQTSTHLPKAFLQDWEVVKHPETGINWIAPGPQAFESVEPVLSKKPEEHATETRNESEPALTNRNTEPRETSAHAARPRRAPITSYTLNSQSFVEYIDKKGAAGRIIAKRSGLGLEPNIKGSKWRPNMSAVLLKMLRQEATNGLLYRSDDERQPVNKFIEPCKSWVDIDQVERKMSVLWLPNDEKVTPTERWATFDRESASYDRKVAVYNLSWLVGPENVQLLRNGSEMFRDHEILVLRHWNSHSMRKLHQLLWRLQGYMDKDMPDTEPSS